MDREAEPEVRLHHGKITLYINNDTGHPANITMRVIHNMLVGRHYVNVRKRGNRQSRMAGGGVDVMGSDRCVAGMAGSESGGAYIP